MKINLSFLIFSLVLSSLNAQGLFEKGYYIDNEGEVIQGYIDIYPLSKTPLGINFKEEKSSPTEIVSILEIKEFKVSGFKFLRFNGEVDLNTSPSNSTEPKFFNKLIFLRTLVEGDANLYSYEDSGSEIFFFSIGSDKPTQLVNTKYLRKDRVISFNRAFRKQIENSLSCESISGLVDDLKYNKKALIDFYEKYNSCLEVTANTYSGIPLISYKYLNISLFIGRSTYSMVSTTQIQNVKVVSFKDNVYPNIGIELEQLLPITKNRFSIWVRGDYKNFSDTEIATIQGVNQNAKLYYNTIESSFGARYYIGNGLLKGFTDIGISKSFEIGDGVYIDYETQKDFDNPQFPPHLVIGLGLMIRNRFVIDTRLEYLDKRLSELESFEDTNYSMLTINLKLLLKSYYK